MLVKISLTLLTKYQPYQRIQSTTTVNGKTSRSWTSSDEVRLELILRADRAEALANGADPKDYTGREFQRRWHELGRKEGDIDKA